MNANDVMMIRAQTQAGAFQRRFQQRSAALVRKLRELNDEDCVLGGHAPKTATGVPSKDTEGQRPALVERGENEKDEEQRHPEDDARRNAFLRFLLLERHAGIVATHLARHGLREGLLKRVHHVARAEAGQPRWR